MKRLECHTRIQKYAHIENSSSVKERLLFSLEDTKQMHTTLYLVIALKETIIKK